MSTFDKREDAYEKQFAHDGELAFKARARRDKMVAHWAAGLLGKSGADEAAYVQGIVAIEVGGGGDDGVFKRLRADFDAAGVGQSDHQIRREMDEALAKARAEIAKEG